MVFFTMRSFFILALFSLVALGLGRNCPAKYKRFTPEHSFCLPPNPNCEILRAGVSQEDIDVILKMHNQFRSKVAMGNEDRAKGGSLPTAANMMQMEWDDELAAVAQKWVEHCEYGHDCHGCRDVENFGVGQNIAKQDFHSDKGDEPDWTGRVTRLYDEVLDYHTSWLGSFKSHAGAKTGHFTQVIWATSWRIGCGYAYFKTGSGYEKYYACNYGPLGNMKKDPVYKQGRPCSACPTNSRCSTSSSFPGLCKMDDPNTAPDYPRDPKVFFYCDHSSNDGDCAIEISGDGTWNKVESVGGNYISIVLNGGQSTTVVYTTPMKARGSRYCMDLDYRIGPMDASKQDKSKFLVHNKIIEGNSRSNPQYVSSEKKNFMDKGFTIPWNKKTVFSFTFSVARGAGPHALDIRKVMGYDGKC